MPSKTIVLFALLVADLAFAGSAREVTWGGVSQFTGKTIQLIAPDAVAVTGKLVAVEAQALSVTIQRSANKVKYRKGKQLRVARENVRTFEVQRNSKHWRIFGTAAGFFVGGAIGAAIELASGLFASGGAGRDAAAFAVWGGCTTGGFFLGRAADQRSFTVVIRPGD